MKNKQNAPKTPQKQKSGHAGKQAKNPATQKIMLGIVIVLLIVLIAVIAFMKPAQPPADQGKIASIPTEIKSQQQASTLEKDTSSVLQEVSGTLNNIDSSLPDV